MKKGRLEAFSDGVFAIIITIMVLELKAPSTADLDSLKPLFKPFLGYVLSFVYVGIYWNNHHHLFQAVETVNGWTLWANLHLLFWLSLFPVITHWMGATNFDTWPVVIYAIVLFMAAIAFTILVRRLIHSHGKESTIAQAIGDDVKGNISLVLYLVSIPLAFIHPWLGCGIFWIVALIWFIPDQRIERGIVEVVQLEE
jgi:uncharacterized membrane protein